MELERYNRSFEEHVILIEEEADAKLRSYRQQCVREFINRLNKTQRDWDSTYREILSQSQEIPELPPPQPDYIPPNNLELNKAKQPVSDKHVTFNDKIQYEQRPSEQEAGLVDKENKPVDEVRDTKNEIDQNDDEDIVYPDPCPKDQHEYFTNISSVNEFVRIQQLLERNRQLFEDINSNPALKPFKNDINLFIRTQINSISNSDKQHLESKVKLLTNLFSGQGVTYQDRLVNPAKHPQGQLCAMDLAAQTFVTVGTRLVNSVPAIAKSMATVINGIVRNQLPLFKDLTLGNLQERCPFLVPMYPKLNDFRGQPDQNIKFMIACGYSYDSRTQSLETEEKYLARMRSMVLIYACILIEDHIGQAWTWLASFLSLKPRPVITATILQAFLQEASKALSKAYGRQYKKLLDFIRSDYIKMIEDVTEKPSERQPLIKLKNLLADDKNLLAAPSVGSIFGSVRFSK